MNLLKSKLFPTYLTLFLSILVIDPRGVQAEFSVSRQLAAFETILMEMEDHYGMTKFKEREFGVSIESVRDKYSQLIREAKTLEESEGLIEPEQREALSKEQFEQLMIGMAAEFRDGHFYVIRQSSDFYTVGLRTAEIEGRLYVLGFMEDYFLKQAVQGTIKSGDEIIEIDGVSPQQLAKERMLYYGTGTYQARFNIGMRTLLSVNHSLFPKPINQDRPVEITLRRKTKDGFETFVAHLPWINIKDHLTLRDQFRYLYPDQIKPNKPVPYFLGMTGSAETYFTKGIKKAEGSDQKKFANGSILPVGDLLNTRIQKAKKAAQKAKGLTQVNYDDDPAQWASLPESLNANDAKFAKLPVASWLSAYRVDYASKRIGVLRVPHYSPHGGVKQVDEEMKWLNEIIETFENTTDVLILDLNSNPGGMVYAGAMLLRAFAHDKPFRTVTADQRLSETYLRALEYWKYSQAPEGENEPFEPSFNGNTNSTTPKKPKRNFAQMNLTERAIEALRARFEAGEEYSGPIPYMQPEEIELRPGVPGIILSGGQKTYSKPILALNDGYSASGGDFVPAILSANQRVTLLGDTSKGLGGPVYRGTENLPGSQLTMRCTYAYCERADGLPIENLGVPVDIHRPIRRSDLSDGFKKYATDVLETALLLAEGKTSQEVAREAAKKELKMRRSKKLDSDKVNKIKLIQELFDRYQSNVALEALPAYSEIDAYVDEHRDELERKALHGSSALANFRRELDTIQGTEKRIEGEEWNRIIFSLPSLLLKQDLFLRYLYDRGSIIDRLHTLSKLERFRDRPFTTRFILDLAHFFETDLGDARIVGNCTSLLDPDIRSVNEEKAKSEKSSSRH